MKYPCDIIKDLLPLYIDDVLSEESRRAVSEHLTECDSCQKYHAAITDDGMLNGDMPITNNEEEKTMSESLKKVKLQINKRQRRMVIAAVVSVLIWLSCWHILFNMPLKTVSLDNIRLTVGSYKLQDLPYHLATTTDENDNGKVTISLQEFNEEDRTPSYRVEIPALPDSQLRVTEEMLDTGGYVSVVSIESRCRLARIDWGIDGDVMYIHTFKTTLLGGSSKEFSQRNDSIDFRPINKVVYLDGGTETVLWENASE